MTATPKTQHDKFKELAREIGCDEDEKAFEEKVKRIAKAPLPKPVPDHEGG